MRSARGRALQMICKRSIDGIGMGTTGVETVGLGRWVGMAVFIAVSFRKTKCHQRFAGSLRIVNILLSSPAWIRTKNDGFRGHSVASYTTGECGNGQGFYALSIVENRGLEPLLKVCHTLVLPLTLIPLDAPKA